MEPRYPRLTTASYEQFKAEYQNGDYPFLRLGQAAFIHFGLKTDNGLFVADDEKADEMIRAMLEEYQA
jgi:hypothetical protein